MRIENVLKDRMNHVQDSQVKEAMLYSLLAGGKRIRPNLLYEVVKGYGKDETLADDFACSLEMIHTYSLIHDDLPAMDNDDLRRGRPTCHKQFDEATAILAGDGLLTEAFHVASNSVLEADIVVKGICILSSMAGASGMVYGQVLDMNEERNSSWDDIQKVHNYKTGCLLSAPLMIGAVIANKEEDIINAWHDIGIQLGLAFQIQDDILDVELSAEEFGKSNSDERNDKVTSVTILGIEKARSFMNELYENAINQIVAMEDFDSASLVEMIQSIETRRK